MNGEQRILEKLDELVQDIGAFSDSAKSLSELRDDLAPRINETVQHLIVQLSEIESDFQLEDVTALLKNLARNIRNLNWSVDQLKSLVDFLRTVEPLLKTTVPQAILFLDGLERRGLFQMLSIFVGVFQRIAEEYTVEDFERLGDVLVQLVGVGKSLGDPLALDLLKRLSAVPASVDLTRVRPAGPVRMGLSLFNGEVRQGLGIVLELTKALGATQDSAASRTESGAAS